jgi:hypothetical protein
MQVQLGRQQARINGSPAGSSSRPAVSQLWRHQQQQRRQQQQHRRPLQPIAAQRGDGGNSPAPSVTPSPMTSFEDDELGNRILSGEFTDSGSTKEKLTRPVRKFLAQDPTGIGEWGVAVVVCCTC